MNTKKVMKEYIVYQKPLAGELAETVMPEGPGQTPVHVDMPEREFLEQRQTPELAMLSGDRFVATRLTSDEAAKLRMTGSDRLIVIENIPVHLLPEDQNGFDELDNPPTPRPMERENIGRKSIGADKLHALGIRGQGVVIATIDTGLAPHSDIDKSRIVEFKDFTPAAKTEPYDDHGHGTHVSGSEAAKAGNPDSGQTGVAPDTGLAIYKALDGRGGGTLAGVLKCIEAAGKFAETHQVYVVGNMSLGADTNMDPANDPMVQEIERQTAKGWIHYCVAMGNSGPNAQPSSPAYAPHAIAVAADDQKGTADLSDDTIAQFSSGGNKYKNPSVSAAGVNVESTWKDNMYRKASGTSMATPHVTGETALLVCEALTLERAGKLKDGVTPKTIDYKALVEDSALDRPNQPERLEGKGIARADKAAELLIQRYAKPGVTLESLKEG